MLGYENIKYANNLYFKYMANITFPWKDYRIFSPENIDPF
jgi:hypothetical protein